MTNDELTTDQAAKLHDFLRLVKANGYGFVTIVVERGAVKFIQPTYSVNVYEEPADESEMLDNVG